MESNNNRIAILLVITMLVSMTLGAAAGGVVGGIAGYALASHRLDRQVGTASGVGLPAASVAGASAVLVEPAAPIRVAIPAQRSSGTGGSTSAAACALTARNSASAQA